DGVSSPVDLMSAFGGDVANAPVHARVQCTSRAWTAIAGAAARPRSSPRAPRQRANRDWHFANSAPSQAASVAAVTRASDAPVRAAIPPWLEVRRCASLGRSAMRKLILISIIFATVVIPLRAARARSARRGLEQALFAMLVFDVFYLLAVMFLYPHV